MAQCCCCATDSDRFCVGSWTARLPDQVVFLNPTRPHRVGPPCSFTDGPPLGWVPRLGRFHACVLIETQSVSFVTL